MLKELFKLYPQIDSPKGEVKLSLVCAVPSVTKQKNSLKITAQPDKAERAFTGYCLNDTPMSQILQLAAEKNERVLLRFEKQRKKDVDINISIAELSKDITTGQKYVINACVGVYDFKNKNWILSANHSNPDDDPADIQNVINECLKGENDIDVDNFFEVQQVRIPNPRNFDTQQQLITMYFFILGCEKKHDYSLKDETRIEFAKRLLELADEIQKIIKEADYVDHKDYSHTRARFMIFQFEEFVNHLDKEAVVNLNTWMKDCYKYSKQILEWTKEN